MLPFVGVAALGAAAAATRTRSYDFFWHLATGRWILGHGSVPEADPFSFTAAGTPWVDHGWLYQLVLWGLWTSAGPLAAWLVKLALAAALAGFTWHHLRRHAVAPAAAMLLVLGGLAGASPRFADRPEMVTLLFTAMAAAWLCSNSRAPLALIPLAAVWANVHAGSILAPLMAGAALVGAAGERALRRAGDRPDGRRLVILALAAVGSAAALLLNPYGAQVILVPLRLARIVGQTWAPNPEWSWPTPAAMPGLYIAVVGLATAALLRRDRLRGVPLALGLLGAALGLRYVRNVGVFFVLFPFAAAPFFSGASRLERAPRWAGGVLAALGVAGFLLAPGSGSLGAGLEPGRYPVAAGDFLQGEGIDGRVFNEVAFGGYLIWRFPGRPVFIDGRNEIYTELLPEIFEALEAPRRFWALTERWEIQAAVLRYPPEGQLVRYPGPPPRFVRRSWSEVYFPSRDWALVHWDDTAMVRVRRDAVGPAWLARAELELNPDDWPFVRGQVLAGELDPVVLGAELDRKIAADPGCRRARALRAALERLMGVG